MKGNAEVCAGHAGLLFTSFAFFNSRPNKRNYNDDNDDNGNPYRSYSTKLSLPPRGSCRSCLRSQGHGCASRWQVGKSPAITNDWQFGSHRLQPFNAHVESAREQLHPQKLHDLFRPKGCTTALTVGRADRPASSPTKQHFESRSYRFGPNMARERL